MSEAHKANVRKLPCLSCGKEPAGECNHLMHAEHGSNGRGLGRKQADRYGLPACRKCHAAVTDVGDDEAWYAKHGIDARAVANALWAERDDLFSMERVIFRARQAARRNVTS